MRERAEPERRAAVRLVAHGRHQIHALQPHRLLRGAGAAARALVARVEPVPPALDRPDRQLVRRPGRPGLGRQRHERHEVRPRRALGHVAARRP
jgi:hypothetical protein